MSIRIGERWIGHGHHPFIIAEMSGNHNHSLDRALAIVDAAAIAGVDAVKLQTYTADTMTLDIHDGDFFIEDPDSLWRGESLYRLYKEAYTPWEWHEPIFQRAKERGILAFSSPFDASAIDFLESLDVPAYKIASFENTDIQLVRKAASTGKPLIISTGMATAGELDQTVREARNAGAKGIILLKCTSTYPSSPESSNLLTLPHMRQLFECEVGLSDHTMGIGVSVASVALGASMIEKHFTLSRADGGVDSTFSMEPHEMSALVRETNQAWKALGHVEYGPSAAEIPSLKHRRSLYISQDLTAGETLNTDNIKAIRPGLGLQTKYLDILIGRRVTRDVKKGEPVTWDII